MTIAEVLASGDSFSAMTCQVIKSYRGVHDEWGPYYNLQLTDQTGVCDAFVGKPAGLPDAAAELMGRTVIVAGKVELRKGEKRLKLSSCVLSSMLEQPRSSAQPAPTPAPQQQRSGAGAYVPPAKPTLDECLMFAQKAFNGLHQTFFPGTTPGATTAAALVPSVNTLLIAYTKGDCLLLYQPDDEIPF